MFPHAFSVHVCSVPEWKGLTCQIWPKWAASYFSESNEKTFLALEIAGQRERARDRAIVRDWNGMKIYLPIARFGARLHVHHAAREKGNVFKDSVRDSPEKMCSICFSNEAWRAQKRTPRCDAIHLDMCGYASTTRAVLCFLNALMCLDSLARGPLSALLQPMCYLAACDAACNWIDTPAPLGEGFCFPSMLGQHDSRGIHTGPNNENIKICAISRMRKKTTKGDEKKSGKK